MTKPEFRIQVEQGEYYWVLKSTQGSHIARSCSTFTRRRTAKRAIETAKKAMAAAELVLK